MSHGTNFKTEFYISGRVFNHKWEVESAIEEVKDTIRGMRDTLHMLASGNPKDLTPNDETPINYIQSVFDETLSELPCAYIELYQLEKFLEELGEKDMKQYQDI